MSPVKDVAHFISTWTSSKCGLASDIPAELFDTHPLSEMILTSEAESSVIDSLLLVENQWRPEWHKNGVQVPVNPSVTLRRKPIRAKQSSVQLNPLYDLRPTHLWRDESVRGPYVVDCRYPLYQVDDLDFAWLAIVNEERECLGLSVIAVWMFEKVMEALEHLSYIKLSERIKALEAESLEFDENAKCDVCLSYEGEDGNELVFCDGCFLCVHQACYGIPKLPEGSWICNQCKAGVKSTTPCSLCPNTGGAMKTNEDGTRWCHISCALWVPEVSFANVELMEPVVQLDSIPQARRRLLCCICRSRYGAPIQCSHKKCKVAFHVTCAFQSNLTMRQELAEKDIHLVSLCPRHSRKDQRHHLPRSPKVKLHGNTARGNSKQIPQSPGASSDLNQGPSIDWKQKLLDLEDNFYKLVDDKELELWLDKSVMMTNGERGDRSSRSNASTVGPPMIPGDVRSSVAVYWRLKRRANFNQPLICPTPFHWRQTAYRAAETTKEALAQAERAAADIQAFEAFRRIRFGLDRSRLVVDMVLQRERRKLALFRRMWRIFELQARLLSGARLPNLSQEDFKYFSAAHIGISVYDNWNVFEGYRSRTFEQPTSEPNEVDQCSAVEVTEETQGAISHFTNPAPEPNKTVAHSHPDSPDGVLYTIPFEQLIVPEDIRQRLRSALNSVKNDPRHRLFFKENLIEPPVTNSKPSATGYRSRKRTLPTFALQNGDSLVDLPAQATSGDDVRPRPTSVKRLKRLSLNYKADCDDDSFSSHPIPILTKFALVKFANDPVK